MQVEFSVESITFRVPTKRAFHRCVEQLFQDHQCQAGYLHYIFCNDELILRINREYLGHDYVTDIITFPYEEEGEISSDLYICIPEVQRNAIRFGERTAREVDRVMLHGLLHLVGYDDHSDEDLAQMRAAEERYMTLLDEMRKGGVDVLPEGEG